MRVVLVDDNAMLRETLRDLLQEDPGTQVVFEARSEAEGRAWLQQNRDGWDLLVVDLFLPDGNGFKVLRECEVRHPHQRAVVLSNYAVEHVRDYALKAGADAFFDKSGDLQALQEYCRAAA
jgi:DNA-binding NarL/FixJ family response regulator